VWIADSQADTLRTIARLDPRTGEVRNYRVPGRYGLAREGHGLVVDKNGHAWLNTGGGLLGVDPKADKVTYYQPPRGIGGVGGTLDADNDGMIWASSAEGAVRFDPATGKFTDYKSKVRGFVGMTYGIAVDSQGNGWWAQMAIDRLVVGNGRTGEITEVPLAPVAKWDNLLTDRDRKVFSQIGSFWNNAAPWAQGPRRLGAERNGNYVWVANYWGNNLARIDIRTHRVTYYDYPDQKAFPGIYEVTVDKNGIVWLCMMNSDTVVKFDPKAEKWTEYRVPSLGTEARFVAVDNTKDPVEVWMPAYRLNKIMRLQFRHNPRAQLQAKQ
jgi:streptogramin lyase